jgi:RNA polymerase sigma-70 factor (ECF subfamily)
MEQADTLRLISRSREGDSIAVEALVARYSSLVYRLALSMLDDPAEADEATQDAFIAAVAKLDAYRGEAAFTTWLYAIALNVCRGRLRKRRAKEHLMGALQALFGVTAVQVAHPEQVVIRNEADAALWRAVKSLDDKQREAVILRYYHDLRLKDIAQTMGVSERTVRTWLHSAHEKMRTSLKDEMGMR